MSNIFEKEFNKSTVFRDRNLITPHYTPPKLPFREKQIEEMTQILGVTLNGKKPDNLFIYGKPGIGKTACSKHVLQQLLEFAGQKNVAVSGSYINCRNHNSKYRVLMKAIKEFFPEQNFLGFSAAFVYEKVLEYVRQGKELVMVLDEIDKVKDLDDLVYCLTRGNDELSKGSISLVGISNNLLFKERLDPRTKSSLCEHELVFAPYNAEELNAILEQRVELAFKPNTVTKSAINLASAFAAQESGDARTAVMLLLRAGEIADKRGMSKVDDELVRKAKNKVEQEIIYNMISTLPEQQQLVLYAIACLSSEKKPVKKLSGQEENILFSGEVYDCYSGIAKKYKENIVSSRWYREYINELEMYGLIVTTQSGKGTKGQTTFIKLGFDAKKIKELIEKHLTTP